MTRFWVLTWDSKGTKVWRNSGGMTKKQKRDGVMAGLVTNSSLKIATSAFETKYNSTKNYFMTSNRHIGVISLLM